MIWTSVNASRRAAAGMSLALLLAQAVVVPAAAASAPLGLFGPNLIVNGGAEDGAGSPSSVGGVVAVPGWTTTGNFTVVEYETQPDVPDSFPTMDSPGSPDRGTNFFVGGPNNTSSSASQVIGVASAAKLIDSGLVRFTLAGWLGGFAGQNDNAVVTATFARANGSPVGTTSIGPVLAADRDGVTGLLPRAAFGTVPAGTRQIVVRVQMTKDATFFYNDGYADQLSLTLASLFGSNIVANGGAELGASTGDWTASVGAPGWTASGNASVGPYDADGFPTSSDPGPASRGYNLFIGGPDNGASGFSQEIDVAAGRRLIDTGLVPFSLSAYLGGWTDQNDHATVTVTFRDGDGDALGSAQIGPVTSADRGDATGLLYRQSAGSVPAGTRSILVELGFVRDAPPEFTYNDGSVDEVRLVLGL